MQKQRRLQRLSQDLAPVDCPVKCIELAGVIERIQDKRGQAKDVKVGCPRSRPPPEENIEPDRQVNQRDEPETLILASVGGLQQNGCVDGNPGTDQGVVDVPPGA